MKTGKKDRLPWAVIFAVASMLALPALAQTFEHDDLNRLKNTTYSNGSLITSVYDAAGNIVRRTQLGSVAASSCRLKPTGVLFREAFDGQQVDTAVWDVLHTDSGHLQVAAGVLTVAGDGPSLPTLVAKINPFPSSGNFSLYCRARYTAFSASWGDYACVATALGGDNNGDGGPVLAVSGGDRLFQYAAMNARYPQRPPAAYSELGPDTALHDFETCIEDDHVSTFVDGHLLAETDFPAQWSRPQYLWIGSLFSPGTPAPWAAFEVHHLEVRALSAR